MTSLPLPEMPDGASVLDADGGEEIVRTSWPRARLVSGACMAGVALALASPLALVHADARLVALSLIPLLLATFVVRWASEGRRLKARAPLSPRFVAGSIPAAALGVFVVTAIDALLTIDVDPLATLLSLGLTVGAVCVAGAARSVEVRVRLASRMVFLFGSGEQRRDLERQARRHGDMRIVGFGRAGELAAGSRSGESLAETVAGADTTTLVLSAEAMRSESICAAASLCNLAGCKVRTLEDFYEEQFKRVPLSELTPSWFLFDIAEIHRPRLYARAKRSIETLVAASLLVLCAPLLAIFAIAVRLSGPGPVLFRQQRIGRDSETFTMVKFRTMRPADSSAEAAWAGADAERITAVGRRLRRYRLDELPQLWNVLRGQLSLIGPRPEQIPIARRLEAEIPFYAARHVVRPGLTGWAQVNCGYGGSLEGTLEKLQFDLYYVKHQSLRLDLLILASTLHAIVVGSDV